MSKELVFMAPVQVKKELNIANIYDLTVLDFYAKAKKMLKTTTLHTGEIASMVGYKDQHYFSVVFRKVQGSSPRDYRNGKEI